MKVLFLGKRFYTNRDALRERYGRIWNLPWHWSRSGVSTHLWLLDYHTRETTRESFGLLEVQSTSVRRLGLPVAWIKTLRSGKSNVELLVASGDCYIGILGYQLARALGARFVFDVYDKYDEFRGYVGFPGFDPFLFLLRRADAVLFASQEMLNRSERDFSSKLLVPNGVDYEHFRPLDMQENRERFGLKAGSRCIGYFGSLTPDRGAADLIAAVVELRNEGFEVDVVLAGQEEGASIPDLPWVHYLGNLPYKEVPKAMASCDLLALPYRRSGYLDMASSCKIAEYIAVQRPVVATDTLNFRSNFPEQHAALSGLLAMPGSPGDLARVIKEQFALRRLVALPKRFSWESIAADLGAALFSKRKN